METWVVLKAEKLGIEIEQAKNEVELIHLIQLREGNAPCFATAWCHLDRESDCCWKDFCKAGVFSI